MCYTPMVNYISLRLQHVFLNILIITQLALVHRCQEIQPSDPSLFCQHYMDLNSNSSQLRTLTDVVSRPDFCPWDEECDGKCNGKCHKPLGFNKVYCTFTNSTAMNQCPRGACLCSDPKLTCFEKNRCPCATEVDSHEEPRECCVHAIYCIMATGKVTADRLCFIPLDDPGRGVVCLGFGNFCQTLENYFCDTSCLTSITSTISSTEGNNGKTSRAPSVSSTRMRLVYYIGGPLLVLVIVSATIAIIICILKKRGSQNEEDVINDVDRYTTADHPQRSVNPADTRDSNLDNPMYDMQILGESTSNASGSRPSSPIRPTDFNDNSRSYENISPSPSIPSSPTSEQAMLLPNSKSSTGKLSQLSVPVFNALQNRQRGTRSRVTFLPRTPSPELERKMLPGEEYEAIVPSSPSDTGSPCPLTSDDMIPMFPLKKKSVDSGYENATLSPNGKLQTKTRKGSTGYENTNLVEPEGTHEIYDYADVVFDPSKTNPSSPNRSPNDNVEYATPEIRKVDKTSPSSPNRSPNDDVEYATPEIKKVDYNQSKPINRPPGGNQYNKLDCSSQVTPQSEEGGEYSKLRREGGSDVTHRKQTLKSLPDVIRVGQKPH